MAGISNGSKRLSRYDLIIGITSLWLLIPVSYGTVSLLTIQEGMGWSTGILVLWTLLTSCVSTIMWKSNVPGTPLHNFDLFCARVEFVVLLLYGAFVGGLPTWAQCVFAAAVAIVYHVTMIFEKKQMWLHKTWMHLFFRYIGYWWIHVSLVHEKYPLRSFFFLSLVYYSHIILKMWHLSQNMKFNIKNDYEQGAIEMMVVLGISCLVIDAAF